MPSALILMNVIAYLATSGSGGLMSGQVDGMVGKIFEHSNQFNSEFASMPRMQ